MLHMRICYIHITRYNPLGACPGHEHRRQVHPGHGRYGDRGLRSPRTLTH